MHRIFLAVLFTANLLHAASEEKLIDSMGDATAWKPKESAGVTVAAEAEAKEGVLSLMIKRADKPSTVKIPVRPLGRFAPTYPTKCKKSDLIFREICEYLAAGKAIVASDVGEVTRMVEGRAQGARGLSVP